jgi:hypothetical protein
MYNNDLKFSLWCDFVERSFLEGEFGELIQNNIVNAATSNPSIFKSAFLGSSAYAEDKAKLQGKSAKEIYEALAISDIQLAAKKLLPSYEKGDDGFISIEVDPFLCDDAEATILIHQSDVIPNLVRYFLLVHHGYNHNLNRQQECQQRVQLEYHFSNHQPSVFRLAEH